LNNGYQFALIRDEDKQIGQMDWFEWWADDVLTTFLQLLYINTPNVFCLFPKDSTSPNIFVS
jgi:hypothetical protein